MESLTLLLPLLIGILIGGILSYYLLKASKVDKSRFDELNEQHIELNSQSSYLEKEKADLDTKITQLENQLQEKEQASQILRDQTAQLKSEIEVLSSQLLEKSDLLQSISESLSELQKENQRHFTEKTQLAEANKNLTEKLSSQKEEILQLHEQSKEQFENLANKIFEEKSTKFSAATSTGLKQILEPFQEKIIELKTKVSETYDKESKERFSLGERVKELAELNQQISQDAKSLTRALKGESKTQGNWGEMILESILEKSGLVKGREYFMEYQLTDQDNKALYSQHSGKKMRPDAVVQYPDNRSVIIDSKVSLTAFSELIDESDQEQYDLKAKLHLSSVKNHINQLSQKAYDDYDKSLDFVMMFIPNEAAYIAAMQQDPALWNYAYDKRILLLSPSNLITSLKLIADLWKREDQNRNALEIADRGAKLYDKFVLFLENLEKVGKNLETAQNNYRDAHKQLYSGRDSLITQTQKMKDLGLKSKKQIPQSLIDLSQEDWTDTIEDKPTP